MSSAAAANGGKYKPRDEQGTGKEKKENDEEDLEPIVIGKASKKDPRNSRLHKYNPLSRVFFCWMDSLIYKGSRHELTEQDLYKCPSEADSQTLLEKFNKHWAVEKNRSTTAHLWLAIVKCLTWRIVAHGFIGVVLVALLVCQSILLGYLSDYFSIVDPSSVETRNAYLLAGGMAFVSFILVGINGTMGFFGYKLGMLVRVIATSSIYQKMMLLSPSKVSQLTIGHIVNLASNDVHRFDQSLLFYHFLWIGPIHLAVVTYFVYVEIGPTALLATLLVMLQIPFQYFLGQMFINLRLKAAKLTDQRVVVMNEVISGIRVIKLYGWEYAFHSMVTDIRRLEVRAILKGAVIRVINLSYYPMALPTILFVVFSVYVSIDESNRLTSKKVFTTLSLLTFVRLISLNFLVKGVIQLSEARVALKRITNFLLLDEKGLEIKDSQTDSRTRLLKISNFRKRQSSSASLLSQSETETEELIGETGILVRKMSASWSNDRNSSETLLNISFKLDKTNPLLAVVGAVGAGKSTLLQCLLKELVPLRGEVTVKGTIGYVSQEPWIFSDTVRQNILFGAQYDLYWYNTVIDACALDKDIDLLPEGDMTIVGERGVTLSGGQKARINLARAVYRKADIYLLDDPLSAVDAAVSRHIFDKCIRGILSDACVLLVTHQLQYLQQCDWILALKEGCVTAYGDPVKILNGETDILALVGGADNEGGVADPRHQFAVRRFSFDMTAPKAAPPPSVMSTPRAQRLLTITEDKELLSDDCEDDDGEDDDNDSVVMAVKSLPFLDSDLPNEDSLHEGTFGDTSSVYSAPPLSPMFYTQKSYSSNKTDQEVVPKTPPPEERAQGTIGAKTYFRYFWSGGGYFTIFLVLVFLFAECCIVTADWWIADWASCDQSSNISSSSQCSLNDQQRIGIYSAIVSSVWVSCISRSLLFYVLALRGARVLHNKMFTSILRAPVLFFDTNPIGRVLNRFSKDIGFIDDILIFTFCEFLQLITRFFSIMITAIVANYYLIAIVVILCIVFVLFRWYYLRTARSIKRIEALSRSPLYSHISMSLQGLSTIRAYQMVQDMTRMFHSYHNAHTEAWYMYIVSSRWFGMRIDFISSLFLTSVAFISVPLAGTLNPGLIGLALTYAISLNGMFQYCIRQSAEVESLMVSAERVIAYGREIESEAPFETIPQSERPPDEWPDKGRIEFSDISYRHSVDSPTVLRYISCTVESGEKVGIVGRTGAGKSSLIASIFRLAEPTGSIVIDGIKTGTLGLHDLRKRISIIPQDPVLFTGTIRYNLDPFNTYSDHDIWKALEQVQLKWTVECLDEELGALVTEGGSNFSVGQRQLFCLARALLRNNKILIMDEATANVDLETDAIIQQVIREQFSHCTVLTIAHRLDTVMDSDKIMVLRFGELTEFDEPHLLLSKPDSYLLRLVDHTGAEASARLKEMALEAYRAKRELTPL